LSNIFYCISNYPLLFENSQILKKIEKISSSRLEEFNIIAITTILNAINNFEKPIFKTEAFKSLEIKIINSNYNNFFILF